jgi:hypothetical protein
MKKLTKEVNDLYNENYETLKKLKKTQKDGKTSMFMGQQNQYFENGHNTKSNKCNIHQNSNDILHRTRKINSKIHKEAKVTTNSQSHPEQKE